MALQPRQDGREDWIAIHQLDFPLVKLTNFVSREEALAGDINPFALVTAAHLYTQRTRNAPVLRFEAKRRLVRALYQRDWSKACVLEFFAILDWMMQLPEELELELWQDIESIEGEISVKYVTSVERLAIARGERIGIEKGIERGARDGLPTC